MFNFYRKDYFDDKDLKTAFKEKYGRELTPPATWEEALDVTKFFTKSENPDSPTEYGITLMFPRTHTLFYMYINWFSEFRRSESGIAKLGQVSLDWGDLFTAEHTPAFNSEAGVKSIQMMMFEASFYAKHPKSPSNILIEELISARKRGVKVEVILETSDRGDRATERNRQTGKMLSKGGVEVIYDPLFVTTHAKVIIIDGRINLLGSTNWTYHSLTSNHEVVVLIDSEEVAGTLQYYFDRVKTSGHRK